MAWLVAAGILLTRIAGVIRESVFAHYLGNSDAADAFKAGFRIPNILQNLLGEGVLSASFIPVYSRLLGEGDEEMADTAGMGRRRDARARSCGPGRAGNVGYAVADRGDRAGIHGAKRELTIAVVRMLFPGAGTAGDVGVVPRRAQQPSSILRLLYRAGRVEPRDDRRARHLRTAPFAGRARDRSGVGRGGRRAAANRGAAAANAAAGRPPADRFRAHAHGS